jgi:hypothetical protein
MGKLATSSTRRPKGTCSQHDFTVDRPNVLWLTEITDAADEGGAGLQPVWSYTPTAVGRSENLAGIFVPGREPAAGVLPIGVHPQYRYQCSDVRVNPVSCAFLSGRQGASVV